MVVFVASQHNPQSASHRQPAFHPPHEERGLNAHSWPNPEPNGYHRPEQITPESHPGLEAEAQRIFDIPYGDLSPRLQSGIQKTVAAQHAQELLAAVKVARQFFVNPGSFNPCSVERMYEAALAKAEGRAL